MARKSKSVLLPWWVHIILSLLVYAVTKFVIPIFIPEYNSEDPLESFVFILVLGGIAENGWFFSIAFLITGLISFLKMKEKNWKMEGKKKLFDKQKDINSIRDLSWKEFEELIGEFYRRKGYQVIENEGRGADGGIDLRLKKDGALYLVQCKNWRSYNVGVNIVREMLGVLVAENAYKMIIVTSGKFSKEAVVFAEDQPIELIDGYKLEKLINSLKNDVKPLEYIRNISFEEYKAIVTKIYQKNGYHPKENYLSDVDGSFNVCLEKNRLFHFIWCSQWHLKVTQPSLERMYRQFINEENAIKMTVITTGEFTNDAREFAKKDETIELIDGNQFVKMINKSRIKLRELDN